MVLFDRILNLHWFKYIFDQFLYYPLVAYNGIALLSSDFNIGELNEMNSVLNLVVLVKCEARF